MKNVRRFVFASLSTLLLAAGFSRAADRLDPIAASFRTIDLGQAPADGCMGCTSCDAPADGCMGCTSCDAPADGCMGCTSCDAPTA